MDLVVASSIHTWSLLLDCTDHVVSLVADMHLAIRCTGHPRYIPETEIRDKSCLYKRDSTLEEHKEV